ncbi:MAG: Grx4 family monothiol glutaredoxin [Rickettsiaceae bacterium]|nr:Grx4 family monothiol glutaredoxin [Rickettsiaceae bacterium]
MSENEVFKQIKEHVSSNEVVLFMKGTADFPQCGFSAMVVGILQTLGLKFKDINVLTDNDLRQGIKEYSDWPTIPQLYIGGEFIGGCDVVRELYESGELNNILKVAYTSHMNTLNQHNEENIGAKN